MKHDLEDRIQDLEEENNNLKRQLLVAEKMRHDLQVKKVAHDSDAFDPKLFAAGVAHEFNNILGSMEGYTQWALESKDTENYLEALKMVKIACERSSQITKSLQGFSKFSENQKSLQAIKIILSDLKSLLAKTIQDKNISLSFDLKDEQLYFSQIQIIEIIYNLIINGIDSIGESTPGKIKIYSQQKDQSYKIFIQDNGCGIPDVYQDKIFQPFFSSKGVISHATINQNKPKSGDELGGSGLGLFISKIYAQEHGGDLLLVDSSEVGTVFCLSLPMIK